MIGAPVFGAGRPPVEPQALAARILSESRFRVRVPGAAHRTWLDAAWQWLADRWNSLVQAFAQNVHMGRGFSIAIGDIAIASAVLIVAAACASLLMRAAHDRSAASSSAVMTLRESAASLYGRAVAASSDGRYAAAIVLVFRATLAALDLRHAIDDAPSHTVNECRIEVRARAPGLYAPFEEVARAFTAVAYAGATASQSDWNAVRMVYETHFTRYLNAS